MQLQSAELCAAPADVRERQPSHQDVALFAENEERIGEIVSMILGIPLDAATKGRTGKIVGRPGRLPRGKEIPACLAQRDPFGTIRHLGHSKYHALASNRRRWIGDADGAKKCHVPAVTVPKRQLIGTRFPAVSTYVVDSF